MQEKLLIIQTAFIGDAVLTLPMIEKLSEQKPGALIDVVAINSTAEIFKNSPFINDVLIFEKRGRHKSLPGIFSFAKELRKRKYSAIYSPHRSFRTSLLVFLSGVKETYGFDKASFPFIYKNIIKYRSDFHEVKRNLEIIGYDTSDDRWKIIPRIKDNTLIAEKIDNLLAGIPSGFIAVAPGSVWETKKYPMHLFKELTGLFVDEGYNVVLIGGKEDVSLCNSIKEKFNEKVYSFAGQLTLTESLFLLKKSAFVISNDSAPTHLSLMAGVPAVTIYCSTVPEFGFYPYHKKSRYINLAPLDCKPCGIHGRVKCPTGTFECALKITPTKIFKAGKAILE